MAGSHLSTRLRSPSHDGRLFRFLKNDIDRVFREFDDFTFPVFTRHEDSGLHPSLDVAETPEDVEIVVELPGVDEDALDVTAKGNTLVITGEKKVESDREDKDMKIVERSFGSFTRTLPFAFPVDPEGVKASFRNGVLSVTVRKPPEIVEKTHRIKIGKTSK